MNPSIPASQLVSVIPSVLGAGGNPLSLNAVFLTEDTSIPVGQVQAFPSAAAVASWFGANSQEALDANVYFGGFEGANMLPGTLYFFQYVAANVAGYIRGGSQAGVSLTAIQALSGTITIVVDGNAPVTTANINLSSATSFSNAAALVDSALTTASAGAHCTYDALRNAFVITSSTTGASSSVGFPTTDSLTTGLKLTVATGAVQSAGAAATTPAAAMNAIVAQTQNWATFMTVFEPITAVKLAFAAWVSGVSLAGQERFAYVAWDSDASPAAGPAPSSFGATVITNNYNGVVPVWDKSSGLKAAFICGVTASLDFTETQGRITYAYKNQAGLVADVVDATTAQNLEGNGYNFYGAYATANQAFTFLQPGSMPGVWDWIDPYINQIAMNADFQLALMSLLAAVKSVPYNQRGFSLLRAALLDPINKYLNFGAIQPGVALSSSQAAQINTAAGLVIAPVISQVGWYLQILQASPSTRGTRGSPPMTFWYTDGGSVQKINLASIDVQ